MKQSVNPVMFRELCYVCHGVAEPKITALIDDEYNTLCPACARNRLSAAHSRRPIQWDIFFGWLLAVIFSVGCWVVIGWWLLP